MEQVVLVDENDNQIGVEEKIKAHENGGKLHRAFSIFVFNSKGELLLQQRASVKYHFSNLWSNTCCGHPRPEEFLNSAVHRRLREEFGFDTELKENGSLIYNANFTNGLTEREFDHSFIGIFNGEPEPNPEEIGDYKWICIEELKKDIKENSEKYTPWFKMFVSRINFEKELKLLID